MNKNNVRYTELPVFEIYNAVKSGELKCFPNGVLDKEICKSLVRKVMLEEDKLTRDDICKLDFRKYLQSKCLYTVIKKFDGSIFKFVSYCFPEMDIKIWELKKVPNGFWEIDSNRLEAIMWLAKKEDINLDNLEEAKRINGRMLYKYFGNKIVACSNNSIFELLDLYYKGKYKEWQVLSKMNKWSDDKVIAATRWLIEDVYGWSREEVCRNISTQVFYKNGLESMLEHACRHSVLIALKKAYPEQNYTKKDIKCTIEGVE